MCGICGILNLERDRPIDVDLLRTMNSTLRHRGPDDEGMFVAGQVGLAMRRLSIIDLGGGGQPISNEDKTLWIVFNGEIYNYADLRKELERRGHTLRTRSDTEVIVHLYEEMGTDCVKRLNGMFAFALWDETRACLFLARDRLGIKPLFYAHEPGRRFIFGSEIKALLAGGVEREPNYQALYDYLSLMYVPTPSSAYRSIFKLPPGCTMTCSSKGVDISQYWDLPLPDAGEEEPVTRDTAEQILDLLEVAVRRQMIADVPLGALLSGGLDSTTVTAIMAQKLRVPVKTFTVGFEHKSYDESNEARLVARTLRTNHFEEHGRPPLDHSLKELVAFFDEPFADYSCIPTYMVAQLAAQHVKVVLTGDGGDEIFAGYPTHVAPKVAAWYRLLPGWIRNHCVAPVVHRLPTSLDRISFDYKAKRFVTGSDLPLDRGHYWWKIIFSDEEKRRLCSPDWLNGSMGDSFEAIAPHFKRSERAHPVNRLLYVDSKTFLVDDNLTKVDRMTMALSLEARVPLLDHELVETLAKLDPRGKLPGLKTKHLLRDAVKDILPPDIRRGKKRGFTPPLPYWINEELRGFVQDTLSPERVANTGLLDATYCRTLLHDHFARRRDNNRQIWTLVALIIWWERNFGGI